MAYRAPAPLRAARASVPAPPTTTSVFLGCHPDFVDHPPLGQRLEGPRDVGRVYPVHRATGADDRVQAEDRLLRVLPGQPADHVDLGTDRPRRPRRRRFDSLQDGLGGAALVGRLDNLPADLGVHHHAHAGVFAPCFFHLLHREPLVRAAMPLPEDDFCLPELLRGGASVGQPPVPEHHLVQRDAHGVSGIPPQVLVREEQHFVAALKRPGEGPRRVAGSTHQPATLTDERLQRRGAVHVRHRDNGRPVVERLIDGVPRRVYVVRGRHVRHRTARRHVRQDDADILRRQDISGFGHKVDAAEEDVFDPLLVGGVTRKLEAVAGEVGVFDHFVALVVMPQHHEPLSQRCPCCRDPPVQLGGIHFEVGPRDVLLPADKRRLLSEGDGREHIGRAGVRSSTGRAIQRSPQPQGSAYLPSIPPYLVSKRH